MKPLTLRQRQVYDCIKRHFRQHGFSPSMKDIMAAMGIRGMQAVIDHLAALERKGWITRFIGERRAIRLLGGPWPVTMTTAAGTMLRRVDFG